MGLDMYLTAEVYIGGAYHEIEPKSISVSNRFKDTNDQKPLIWTTYPTENLEEIRYRVGYWRKANQIHNWFVKNVQCGKDDCSEYIVDKEEINELLDICKDLISSKDKDKALELLPPKEGFFFGLSNPEQEHFWEYYWDDIELTISNLENALEYINKYDACIKYTSSW